MDGRRTMSHQTSHEAQPSEASAARRQSSSSRVEGVEQGDDQIAMLSELKDVLTETAHVLQRRAEQASAKASAAASAHPWATVTLAAGLGALAAFALLPRRKRAERTWPYQPDLANLDISRFAAPLESRMRQLQANLPSAEPLTSRLERVLDSISKIDPAVVSMPSFGRAREWLQSVYSNLVGRRD
jgi:ElaB/YqjD/DUF883 family membrane-anchored ribosome-binding protein